MLQSITLGRYYHAASIVHRLDPRCKLLCSLILMVTIMAAEVSWQTMAPVCGLFLTAMVLARVPFRLYFGNLRAFLWLFGITFILHGLTNPTPPHIEVAGLAVSVPGLLVGAQYVLRLMLVVLAAGLLSAATMPSDLADAVERLLRPLRHLRFPVHEFALMTALAMRFIPTIVDEAQRIQRAQISRGARFEGGLLRRVHALVPMLIPLFVSVFNRADELAVAMESRCYAENGERVSFCELQFTRDDYLAMATTALVCTGAFFANGLL